MKNIITRTFTGAIFVAVVLVAICIHEYGFLALFTLFVGLALREFHDCAGLCGWYKWAGITAGAYLFAATFCYASGRIGGAIYIPYLLYLLALLIGGLYRQTSQPVDDWAKAIFAQCYCAGLLSLLNFVAFAPQTTTYSPYYVLLIFIFVWLNDTGAYLIGSTWGRRRLFPRISPRKSWEGFWGGLGVTLAIALLCASLFRQLLPVWYHWPLLALTVVLFGTWGDLLESLIKRTCNVKDSGTLLPGHGGILDRLDSVILATPAVYCYIKFFM